jgi:hypothetical protein
VVAVCATVVVLLLSLFGVESLNRLNNNGGGGVFLGEASCVDLVGACEYGNALSGCSIKCGEFLD